MDPQPIPAKRWYESRTIWLNILAGVLAGSMAVTEVLNGAPEIVTWPTIGACVLAVVNALLRLDTSERIGKT